MVLVHNGKEIKLSDIVAGAFAYAFFILNRPVQSVNDAWKALEQLARRAPATSYGTFFRHHRKEDRKRFEEIARDRLNKTVRVL